MLMHHDYVFDEKIIAQYENLPEIQRLKNVGILKPQECLMICVSVNRLHSSPRIIEIIDHEIIYIDKMSKKHILTEIEINIFLKRSADFIYHDIFHYKNNNSKAYKDIFAILYFVFYQQEFRFDLDYRICKVCNNIRSINLYGKRKGYYGRICKSCENQRLRHKYRCKKEYEKCSQ